MKQINFWIKSSTAFLILSALLIARTDAATLEGIIIGRDRSPKRYVRVELYGSENRVTFTDKTGRFALDVPEGRYTISIIESNRSMKFSVNIPDNREFFLRWR